MTSVLVGVKLIVKLLFGFFLLLPLTIFAFFCSLCCFFLLLPVISIFKSVLILYHVLFKLPIGCLEVVLVRFCKWVFGDFGNFEGTRKLGPFESSSPYDSQGEEDDGGGGENGKRKLEDSWTFQALKAAIKRDKLLYDGKPISIQIRRWLPLSEASHASEGLDNTPPFKNKETNVHDMCVTHDTPNGDITNVDNFLEGESSNSSVDYASTTMCSQWKWKFLWGCNIPGKTRIFVFRACLDALPTNQNLSKKQITVENRCGVCGQQGESTLHVLRECAFAKQVWAAAPVLLVPNTETKNSVFEWVNDTSKDLDPHCFALFITICWFLWKNRNEMSHKKARDLVKSALDYHTNYLTCPDSASKIPQLWLPPCRGSIKVNFDGVVFLDDQDLGVGVVVRDEKGVFMAGMAKKIKFSGALTLRPVSEFAKAAAAVEALRFALEKGFVDVVVEGDFAAVIQALKGVGDSGDCVGSAYGVLYADARRMAKDFVKCEFSIVRRTGNKAAHLVARCARDVDSVTWTDDPPSFLMPYIVNDIPS